MSDYISIFGNVAYRDEDFDDFDAEVAAEKAIFDRKLEKERRDLFILAHDMVLAHRVLGEILELEKDPEKAEAARDKLAELHTRAGAWVEWLAANSVVAKKFDLSIASVPFAKADPVVKPTNG